jgi:hypothetical protein
MKNNLKISIVTIAVIATISLTSCSVEYRTRHPRPVRHRVIVVGMEKSSLLVDSSVGKFVQPLEKMHIVNDIKTK